MNRIIKLIFVMTFILVVLVFEVNAECNHNFEKADDESNVFVVSELSHAYYCLNGCENYGTPDGGINSEEKCVLNTVSVKEPTCISTGKNIYMCTVCYRHKEIITSVTEHRYKRVRKLPTCTQTGYDLVYCTVCDISYRENFTESLKHIPDGGVIEIEPTYNRVGVLRFSCRVCNCLIERKSIPELIKVQEPGKNIKKVSGVKVKEFGSSFVKLRWNKSSDAVSYKVLYSTDKKKWKTLSTEKTYVSVKKLKCASRYYFKVVAVGTSGQSEPSKTVSAHTKPVRSVILEIGSPKKSRAALEWKKLNNVSGYEVSYSRYSFGKNKGIRTVDVPEDTELKLNKLKSGKKYFFRVRAYKKFGSQKVYGAYSKVKTLKIR